jgi:hypothetical protein
MGARERIFASPTRRKTISDEADNKQKSRLGLQSPGGIVSMQTLERPVYIRWSIAM